MVNNIRQLRMEKGYSQATLADKIGVSQQAVTQWETGDAMPRADKLPELARLLGCKVDDLFTNQS